MNAVFTQIWIAICDYLLLIIAKKQYRLNPSLHLISNSIGQILFKRVTSVTFITNLSYPSMFRRRAPPGNSLYGKISPDSNE